MSWVELLIAGGVEGGVIKIIDGVIQWALGRLGKNKDCKTATLADVMKKIQNIEVGQRVILHDRIKFLSAAYIRQNEIYLDELNDLKDMHEVYHGLGGENLVRPMDDVGKLKVKYR